MNIRVYYTEYPIRCKTSNDNIACRVEQYMQLLNGGLTIEQSLNEMGVMNPCCRNAFMNPTYVFFDMENRKLIEGDITKDSLDIYTQEYGVNRGEDKGVSRSNLFINDINTLEIPETVGLSRINEDPVIFREYLPLSSDVSVDILNGRTYLAQ